MKIATGHDLSDNVLDTIFKLFDMDGDNCLSHKEFIGVMKDRVLRGLKVTGGLAHAREPLPSRRTCSRSAAALLPPEL